VGLQSILDCTAVKRGREKEHYQVVYGAKLKVEDGAVVQLGQTLVEWDPYTVAGPDGNWRAPRENCHPDRSGPGFPT
jgi:hypothetical protein